MSIAEQVTLGKVVLRTGRLFNLLLSLVYCVALVWTYANPISEKWSYIGFTYVRPDQDIFATALMAAILPALFLQSSTRRMRDFIICIIYYALYVPAIVLPPLMGNLSYDVNLMLIGSLAAGFAIVCIPSVGMAATSKPPLITVDTRTFWIGFFSIYAALYIWVVAIFGGHFRLVTLEDIYVQRAASDDVLAGSLVGYAIGILSGAFNPFLMALGLVERKYKLLALGAVGQVLLFATMAMKAVLLSIIIIPGFFFLMFRQAPFRSSRIGVAFSVSAAGLAVASAGIYQGPDSLLQIVFTIVYMRTYCMVGVLMGLYTEFFQTHPYTYFSHIGPVRNFVHYPYSDGLGNVIGNFMFPGAGDVMDANASFFATDGMAAYGFAGIVLSGILFRMFVGIFDAAVNPKILAIGCCAMVPVLMSVTNASMFSSLLTNGGGALAAMLFFYGNASQVGQVVRASGPVIVSEGA